MECDDWTERMAELLAGELDARDEARLRAHVQGCARCGSELERMERVWEALAPAPPPPAVQARLYERLVEERERRSLWDRLVQIWTGEVRVPVPALALFAAALLVSLWLNLRGPGAPAPHAALVAAREAGEAVGGPAPGELMRRPLRRDDLMRAAAVRRGAPPPAMQGVDVSGQAMVQLVAY